MTRRERILPLRPARAWAWAVAALLPALPAVPGCNHQEAAEADVRQVILNWHRAMLGGDKQIYLSCFAGEPGELRAVEGLYEYIRAGLAFRRELIAAYGRDGWERYQEHEQAAVRLPPLDPDFYKDTEVRIKEGYALCELPTGMRHFRLDRVDGAWRIDASMWIGWLREGKRADPEAPARARFAFAAVLNEARAQIGAEGIGPDELARRVSEAFDKELQAIYRGQ